MSALFLAALLAAAPASASAPLQPTSRLAPDSKCPSATSYFANGSDGAQARRLDQLPPGRLELTVLREVQGCPIPAVLRDGIGGRPTAEPARSERRR